MSLESITYNGFAADVHRKDNIIETIVITLRRTSLQQFEHALAERNVRYLPIPSSTGQTVTSLPESSYIYQMISQELPKNIFFGSKNSEIVIRLNSDNQGGTAFTSYYGLVEGILKDLGYDTNTFDEYLGRVQDKPSSSEQAESSTWYDKIMKEKRGGRKNFPRGIPTKSLEEMLIEADRFEEKADFSVTTDAVDYLTRQKEVFDYIISNLREDDLRIGLIHTVFDSRARNELLRAEAASQAEIEKGNYVEAGRIVKAAEGFLVNFYSHYPNPFAEPEAFESYGHHSRWWAENQEAVQLYSGSLELKARLLRDIAIMLQDINFLIGNRGQK